MSDTSRGIEMLNKRIALASGWTEIRPNSWQRTDCPSGLVGWPKGHKFTDGDSVVPDYEHSIDACMAVIRERWGDNFQVMCNKMPRWNQGEELWSLSVEGPTHQGPTLAAALLEALTQ